MIKFKIGLPAAGKSTALMKEAARRVAGGEKVLWLTPLKSDGLKTADLLHRNYGVPISDIIVLPSKLESCQIIKRMEKIYHVLLGIAVCRACTVDSCLFKQYVTMALDPNVKGVFIATHKFFWLALRSRFVVVDEGDWLVPDGYEFVPARYAESLLQAIRRLFGESVEKNIRKMLVPVEGGYVFSGLYPTRYFWGDRALHYLTSTVRPGEIEVPLILGLSSTEELVEKTDLGEIDLQMEILPDPSPLDRPDEFYVYPGKVWYTSNERYRLYRWLLSRVKSDLGIKARVLVVARSRREARELYSMIHGRTGGSVLAEGVNWDLGNLMVHGSYSVRIIVVGGRFHRGVNIDSDVVYGFYQHLLPEDVSVLVQRYQRIFGMSVQDAESLVDYLQRRKHIQSIFRGLREWRRRHIVYLLDKEYEASMWAFQHIYTYYTRRFKGNITP